MAKLGVFPYFTVVNKSSPSSDNIKKFVVHRNNSLDVEKKITVAPSLRCSSKRKLGTNVGASNDA